MPMRRCLECQALFDGGGSRCPAHLKKRGPRKDRRGGDGTPHHVRYDHAWRKQSKQIREAYIETWGGMDGATPCRGWGRAPHTVDASELVVDHDLGVMCRACNSRKSVLWDRRPGGAG